MASKLEITEIKAVLEGENREMTVHAVCAVRGAVEIKLSEDDARWLWASMDGRVKEWRKADGDDY